jgi:aldose sugar dehydrogenase
MMTMGLWARWSGLFLVAGAMFAFGYSLHKYKYFPYSQVRLVVKRLINPAGSAPSELLSRQYSTDLDKIYPVKSIDTALLPLKIGGVRFSEHLSIPKVAGALTAVGDIAVVLDRLGNIYSCSLGDENVEKRPFSELPNNVRDYLKLPNSLVDAKKFRAYDIKYMSDSKTLAVSHEYFDKQLGKTKLAVSVVQIDDKTVQPVGAWKTIFLSDPEPNGPNESGGGRLVVRAPNKLYLTIGDYAITSPRVSQDAGSSFGKIIEIDVDTGRSKIVSLGHRNPEGLTITADGALLSTEHGPKGGDKLNLITEGSNYGWPDESLGTDYGSYDLASRASGGPHPDFKSPLFAWLPSIAPSNLIQVAGFDRRWNGDLLVASLKAMSLFRLRLDGTRVLYVEPIWIGQRIRDIAQLKNGIIVLWTDDTQLLFISVDQAQLDQNVRVTKQVNDVMNTACMYCHHFGPTSASDFAPTFTKLFSRKIASDNFRYSAGLRSKQGAWTEDALKEFLSNPAKFANGTGMPPVNLTSEAIDEIVEVLKEAN